MSSACEAMIEHTMPHVEVQDAGGACSEIVLVHSDTVFDDRALTQMQDGLSSINEATVAWSGVRMEECTKDIRAWLTLAFTRLETIDFILTAHVATCCRTVLTVFEEHALPDGDQSLLPYDIGPISTACSRLLEDWYDESDLSGFIRRLLSFATQTIAHVVTLDDITDLAKDSLANCTSLG